MAINYATKEGGALDQKLTSGLFTADLDQSDNALVVDGGKSVVFQTITLPGYKAHTRTKGFNSGEASNARKVHEMKQDRDISIFVDSMDVNETDNALAAANLTKVFEEEKAQPEVDAYRFQTLAQNAPAENRTTGEVTPANVLATVKKALKPLRKFGAGNVVAYVSGNVMDALEQSDKFTRTIDTKAAAGAAIETRITSLDGVKLVEVYDEARFYSAFDFSDGFKAQSTAVPLEIVAVAVPAVRAIVKHAAVFLFEAGEHTEGDGYLYQNRMYHDLFVLEQNADGVAVHTTEAMPALV